MLAVGVGLGIGNPLFTYGFRSVVVVVNRDRQTPQPWVGFAKKLSMQPTRPT